MTTAQLAPLLSEQRRFPPPPDFARTAAATPELYRQAKADRLRFWDEQARVLDWIAPWTKVLESTSPHAKWYLGGTLQPLRTCRDRPVAGGPARRIGWGARGAGPPVGCIGGGGPGAGPPPEQGRADLGGRARGPAH